jgi:5-methylthioadenosine/S-adenosylhomocysteine deaminase
MSILFKDARILSMVDGEALKQGDLVVDGSTISYVGPKAPKAKYERVIDCHGNLLLPGFKDAHTHSAMSFARSLSDDLALHEWLFDKIFPLEAKIQPEDQYYLSKVSILEYLSSGITACFDMYYNPMEMAHAAVDMGFRSVQLGTVTKYRESVAEMEHAYRTINGSNPLVSYQMGFHAEYTATEEILQELSKAAHELHCPIYTHTSETPIEVEGCKQRHGGLTPTEYMESLGLFDYGGGGFHCVAFSKHDIEIYQKHHCSVISCPGSNSKLASGIAPLTDYVEAGLNLALGTDGPGSNNGLDFFWEMRLACVLQKLRSGKPEAFDGLLALKAATVGGAKAMQLKDCETLSVGQQADLVMIDLMKPNMQPLNNIAKNVVYSGSKDDVALTMVAGKILYENGVFHVGEDIETIYQKAQEITDRLKG